MAFAPVHASARLGRYRGTVCELRIARAHFSAGVLRTPIAGREIEFQTATCLELGQYIAGWGHWISTPRYGEQLCLYCDRPQPEVTVATLTAFLHQHPELPVPDQTQLRLLIQRRRAARDFLGHDGQAQRVRTLESLPPDLVRLNAAWEREQALQDTCALLVQLGLPAEATRAALEACTSNGELPTVSWLLPDLYRLVGQVPELDFAAVDRAALQLGCDAHSRARLRGTVRQAVWRQTEQLGFTLAREDDCISVAEQLIGTVDPAQCCSAVGDLLESGELQCHWRGLQSWLTRTTLNDAEGELGHAFARTGPNPHFPLQEPEALAQALDSVLDGSLTTEQLWAVVLALTHSQAAITGRAGTGKSHVCRTIVQAYELFGLRVMLAAPTGKAAQRLKQLTGRPAATLHRLLGYTGSSFPDVGKLDADLVLIDEASMVDVPLAAALYRALDLNRTCVLWVGDPQQLLPVGPGCPFRDLVEQELLPVAHLHQVMRQAGVLRANCDALLAGQLPALPERQSLAGPWYAVYRDRFSEIEAAVDWLYAQGLPARTGFDLLSDVQLLTPMRQGPLGSDRLNRRIQRLVHGHQSHVDGLLLHDRVIQGRNNYDTGVMNGEIGRVVGRHRDVVEVQFDHCTVEYTSRQQQADELQLAYAITIHKSQGSEYPCAIVVAHDCHAHMLSRNLLYVGASRARETGILLGSRSALEAGLAHEETPRRQSCLGRFRTVRPGGYRHDA